MFWDCWVKDLPERKNADGLVAQSEGDLNRTRGVPEVHSSGLDRSIDRPAGAGSEAA